MKCSINRLFAHPFSNSAVYQDAACTADWCLFTYSEPCAPSSFYEKQRGPQAEQLLLVLAYKSLPCLRLPQPGLVLFYLQWEDQAHPAASTPSVQGLVDTCIVQEGPSGLARPCGVVRARGMLSLSD